MATWYTAGMRSAVDVIKSPKDSQLVSVACTPFLSLSQGAFSPISAQYIAVVLNSELFKSLLKKFNST